MNRTQVLAEAARYDGGKTVRADAIGFESWMSTLQMELCLLWAHGLFAYATD
jgi:hypothetical protein